jgi:hypothetical protein
LIVPGRCNFLYASSRPACGRPPAAAVFGRHDTTGHRGTRPHPPLGVLAGVGDLPLAAHQDRFGSGGAAENGVLVAGL